MKCNGGRRSSKSIRDLSFYGTGSCAYQVVLYQNVEVDSLYLNYEMYTRPLERPVPRKLLIIKSAATGYYVLELCISQA
jgi:hypothetical protein